MVARIGRFSFRFLAVVAAGSLVTLGYGRLMLLLGGTCTVACDPATGVILGAFAGGLAFLLDIGGFRSGLREGEGEEDALFRD